MPSKKRPLDYMYDAGKALRVSYEKEFGVPDDPKPRCETCPFYAATKKDEGTCHWDPPEWDARAECHFPRGTHADWWCRHHPLAPNVIPNFWAAVHPDNYPEKGDEEVPDV